MNLNWNTLFLGNTLQNWLIAFGITFGLMLLCRIFRTVLLRRIATFAARSKSILDDYLVKEMKRTVMPYLYILSVYAGYRYLTFPPRVMQVVHIVILSVTIYFVIRLITGILRFAFQRFASQSDTEGSQLRQARGILMILNIVLWIVGIIFLVDNLGYSITTIITGLGIGGVAIALASQAVLADLFSYFVIFFDKPFEIGDFIVVADKSGIVEQVGVKTTRLRTLDGEQLVMSNTDLTNSRVHNYKRMTKRRVLFKIFVSNETPSAKLEALPALFRTVIEKHEPVLFERAHLASLGEFSFNFEIVYHIQTADYMKFMDTQQSVWLALIKEFEKQKIEFAYPTQKSYMLFKDGGNGGGNREMRAKIAGDSD